MITFDCLRFVLSPPNAAPLLNGEKLIDPQVSRKDFLCEIFSKKIDFLHRGSLFSFVPSPIHRQTDLILSGFLGKQSTVEESLGPDDLFARVQAKKWRAAFLAIDISEDEQLMYFERRRDIGDPVAALHHMISERRKDFKESWKIQISHLADARDFWSVAKENQGKLTEIQFILYPPNVLRTFDKIKELHKEFNKEVNGDEGAISFKNAHGALSVDAQVVKDGVVYATEGGGAAILKSGRKKVYDSRRKRRVKEVPPEIMPDQAQRPKILGLIDYLFGRRDGRSD